MKCEVKKTGTTIWLHVSSDEEALALEEMYESSDHGKKIGIISTSKSSGLIGIRSIRIGNREEHGFSKG